MPQNKNLKPVNLPMDLKFGEEPHTKFQNNLSALKVELVDAPTRSQALNVAWQYVKATWADHHDDTNPAATGMQELCQNLEDVLCFRALPTPMECMGFTFKLSGLSFVEQCFYYSVDCQTPFPSLAPSAVSIVSPAAYRFFFWRALSMSYSFSNFSHLNVELLI